MLTERKEIERNVLEIMCTELLVPEEHLLRKIDAAVNFERIYALVNDLYCKDNGRPSVDPVVLFKIVLIQHLYGIRSLRQTVADIDMNIAYRWFLGYKISEAVPHFATVSYNFRHRFSSETIDAVFVWMLEEIAAAGYLSPEVVFIDGTHVKANANMKKQVKRAIPAAAKAYEQQLREEVNADREEHGKKPFDDDPPSNGEKEITVSTTDPDCGVFHKGEHKKCFAYSVQTACDQRNYILGVTVNPGNMHDSVAFDGIYEQVAARFPEIQVEPFPIKQTEKRSQKQNESHDFERIQTVKQQRLATPPWQSHLVRSNQGQNEDAPGCRSTQCNERWRFQLCVWWQTGSSESARI